MQEEGRRDMHVLGKEGPAMQVFQGEGEGMIETHHINLNPSDNTSGNLIRIPSNKHRELHEQLSWFMREWNLNISRGSIEFKIFVDYFFKTGELRFNRELQRYEIHPEESSILWIYERVLNSNGINPSHYPPEKNIGKIKEILLARNNFLAALRGVIK